MIPEHDSPPLTFPGRLPFVRNWLTLYSDSEVHDDVSPADAPRRASWRPGLYLARERELGDYRASFAAIDAGQASNRRTKRQGHAGQGWHDA